MTRPRNVDDKAYAVWRPDCVTEKYARYYDASEAAEAAQFAAERDHAQDGWEWSWPVVYHVRLCESDQIYAVSVDREMVPEFVAGKALPLLMPAAVHVLWGVRALCEDIRLSGVPADWPDEQTWISLADLNDGRSEKAMFNVTCEKCARRAPGLLVGLQQIGQR